MAIAPESFVNLYEASRAALRLWSAEDVLPTSLIAGKKVLDWQCGRGAFSAVLADHDAANVLGIDMPLDDAIRTAGPVRTNLSFAEADVEQLAGDRAQRGAYQLIVANGATSRRVEVSRALRICHRLLAPDGVLVINHDNYYQPVGSQDHGFLGYGARGEIGFRGPRCWETPERCETSAAFRRGLREDVPWSWDDWTELQRDPTNCTRCPYYRRAQPWSHLLFQDDYRLVFPQLFFSSGTPSGLNKITPFLLRQAIIEGGFAVERWLVPYRVPNRPPESLLRAPFAFDEDDLRAVRIAIRCAKAPLASYQILGA